MLGLEDVKQAALGHGRERHTPLREFLDHLRYGNPEHDLTELRALARQALLHQLVKDRRIQLERTILLASQYRQIPLDLALGLLDREESWHPSAAECEPLFCCFVASHPSERAT